MSNKKTYSEMYAEIIKAVGDMLTDEQVEFLEGRKAAIEKKNASRKPSKEQKENEGYKTEILEFMQNGVEYSIGELTKGIPSLNGFSNQKVSALVRLLKEDKAVVRIEKKGKAYFYKA